MSKQKNETNKYSVNAKQTFRRSMTRKNPQTGRSNYPTISTMRSTTTNYINNTKRVIERNYRKIIPSDNNSRN